jgi:ABC-2 type transport system permease protein
MNTTNLPVAPSMPSLLRISRARTKVEIRSFLRSREATLFSLFFPVMLLLLFGSIFGNEDTFAGVKMAQVMSAGILASAVASTSFMSTAIGISVERDEGVLKRLAGTPMPRSAYFLGKIGMVLVTTLIGMALTLTAAVIVFDVDLPSSPTRWLRLGWVTLLGVAACTLCGIAFTRLIPNARQAAAMVNLPFVALNFISGVYVSFWGLPSAMRTIASLFPLKWMAQGYRAALLPDAFQGREVAGSFELGRVALALGAWCIIGCVLCLKTFRWVPRER